MEIFQTIMTILFMAWFFFGVNMFFDMRKSSQERKKKWNRTKKLFLTKTDKKNMDRIDNMILELKQIKQSIGGV